MKQLSIEEKAKAYDKAIAHAKILLKTIGNATLGNLVLKNEFENMFPQLKENEDEKLREQVVYAINQLHVCECTKNKLKSWLEKQCEQKPADIRSIEKRAHEVFPDDDDENTPLYRQAFIDGAVDYIDCDCKKYSWSEEDEKIKRDIENLIHFALKDGGAVSPAADTTKEGAISWIQSLKYRYTWKPSDEQMLAINTAINVLGKGTINGKYLIELQEQLKKLKG